MTLERSQQWPPKPMRKRPHLPLNNSNQSAKPSSPRAGSRPKYSPAWSSHWVYPGGHRLLDHRWRGPEDRLVRILHHGCHHRLRRRAPGHDFRSHRRHRPGHRTPGEIPRDRLLHRRRHPCRHLPSHSWSVGCSEADAVHSTFGDGGLRQRTGDSDLHGSGPRTAWSPVDGLPAHSVGLADCLRVAEADQSRPCPFGGHRGAHPVHRSGSVAVPTVGDKGELPESLPSLFIPNVPFTLETLQVILPFALAMAFVGSPNP